MEGWKMLTEEKVSHKAKQIREILDFQFEISRKFNRKVSLSEAIANWIAFGHAERFRDQILHK